MKHVRRKKGRHIRGQSVLKKLMQGASNRRGTNGKQNDKESTKKIEKYVNSLRNQYLRKSIKLWRKAKNHAIKTCTEEISWSQKTH